MPFRSPAETRRLPHSRPRRRGLLLALGALVPLACGATALLAAPSFASSPTAAAVSSPHASGNYSVAPYTDMSNSQEGLLNTAITQHGLKAFTAAFVIGTGCNQEWGDTLPVGNDPDTDPEIATAVSDGASVIISSGGADGEPLAWTCTDQSSINAGYQNIISSYKVSWLDFDIEGAAIADTAAAARNMQAMKTLEASNPGLKFSVTLPVLPSGLTSDGVNILKAAQSAGVKIDIVNIMAMDYYQGTSQDMGQAAISAAQSTLAQMQSVDPSYTYANLGITPMIGVNDDGSTFSLANAQTVENWAASNGVGRLSFWAITRDQSCSGSAAVVKPRASSTCSGVSQSQLAFTDAFVPFNGGSSTSGGSSTGGSTTGGSTTGGSSTGGTTSGGTSTGGSSTGGGTCAAAWNSSTSYSPGDEVSYDGDNYTATYYSTGAIPGASTSWAVWKDDGPCTG